jgi:hypothetical protein
VILFNIIQPAGWRLGLVRIEDIAIGAGVSLVVGVLFWPRGAAAALRQALAQADADVAGYLASTVRFGMSRGDPGTPALPALAGDAARAAAASRRLDDAFRTYLAERGAKRLPLADVAGLVTGVAGLRLEADAVLDLWQGDDGHAGGDMAAARHEIHPDTAINRPEGRVSRRAGSGSAEPTERQRPLRHRTAARPAARSAGCTGIVPGQATGPR